MITEDRFLLFMIIFTIDLKLHDRCVVVVGTMEKISNCVMSRRQINKQLRLAEEGDLEGSVPALGEGEEELTVEESPKRCNYDDDDRVGSSEHLEWFQIRTSSQQH